MLLGRRDRVAVVLGLGHIIDDVHIEAARGAAAVAVLGGDREALVQAVGAVCVGVGFIVDQGVAVAHHPGGGVVAGDGQGIAQWRGDRLADPGHHTASDDVDPADTQALQAIRRRYAERAALGQGTCVRCAAIVQVFFVDGQLAAIGLEPAQGHRVVEVADVQGQGRAAGVAVGVPDRVGEVFDAIAAPFQPSEVRVSRVEGVGVSAIGRQHQGAVGADKGTGDHRPAGHAVSALLVVAEDVAGQFDMLFGRRDRVAVIHRLGYVIADDHIQAAAGHVTVGIADQYGQMLAEGIGALARGMLLGTGEGVAVTHYAGSGVVAGDGQGIAQWRDNRLPDAGDHASGDHVDAAHAEIEHAIRRDHGERPLLGEGRRIAVRSLGQVGLVHRQLARAEIEPSQADGIVRLAGWWRWRWR
ncbi:hypothetical protein PSRE111525_00415 [Pseudomonas reidholzensis]